MKFVILSDLHVVPPGETSHGVDTGARARRAAAELAANHADAAFCVLLGDLADHGAPQAYAVLKDVLSALKMPLHFLLGNHDLRANFIAAFPHAAHAGDGFVQSVRDTALGRFIFLDSHEPDHVNGKLCDARLAWLQARLNEAPDRPVYVFVHHPPFRIGSWMDDIRLVSPGLAKVLKSHRDVRHIFSGHTHRHCSGVWHGIPFANVGAVHYNCGLHLAGIDDGVTYRYPALGYSTVVLVDDEQVVVHPNEYISPGEPFDPALFPTAPLKAIIANGGRLLQK